MVAAAARTPSTGRRTTGAVGIGTGVLLWAVIGFSERSPSDILVVAVLVVVLVTLCVWGRRRRADYTWGAVVRQSYFESFARVGCDILDVTVLPLDRDLARLVVSIALIGDADADADADSLSAVRATATLCGLNALTRWPTLTSFEVLLHTNGESIPVTALERARHQPLSGSPKQTGPPGGARRRR